MSQSSVSRAAARGTTDGMGPARESDPFAAGMTSPEGADSASQGDPGITEQAEPGDAVSVATGNSYTAGNMKATVTRLSPRPMEPPNVTPATSGATAAMPTGAAEGGGSKRRGRPRAPGRVSRAMKSGRGATTNRERISRPGGDESPPSPVGGRGGGEESELRREGGGGEGGGPIPRGGWQIRAFRCRRPERSDLRGS